MYIEPASLGRLQRFSLRPFKCITGCYQSEPAKKKMFFSSQREPTKKFVLKLVCMCLGVACTDILHSSRIRHPPTPFAFISMNIDSYRVDWAMATRTAASEWLLYSQAALPAYLIVATVPQHCTRTLHHHHIGQLVSIRTMSWRITMSTLNVGCLGINAQ